MAGKKNTPFSVFTAAENIKKRKADNASAGTNSVQMKETPQPSNSIGTSLGKVGRGITAIADNVGLDGKFGFQNSFDSIKGEIGQEIKAKSKKKK